MSNVNKSQILKNWEEIHKQGMLMFWLLTVLQKEAADVDTIQAFDSRAIPENFFCYRAVTVSLPAKILAARLGRLFA